MQAVPQLHADLPIRNLSDGFGLVETLWYFARVDALCRQDA